jgi:hypothetical protein
MVYTSKSTILNILERWREHCDNGLCCSTGLKAGGEVVLSEVGGEVVLAKTE